MGVFKGRLALTGLLLVFGFLLVILREGIISTKTLGTLIIVFCGLVLIEEIWIIYSLKKSRKSRDISDVNLRFIAEYLENNNIKYIFQPKDMKEFEFFLPEYDVYVKYWKEFTNKMNREKILKIAKKMDLKIVEIWHDKITTHQLLHSSFMKRLSQVNKIR